MCGPDVSYPEPSAEEKALSGAQVEAINTQNQMLREQIQQQQLLAPIIYERSGIKPTYDSAGKITGYSEIVDPNRALRDQIETELLNRQLQAMHGELPVDPTLTRTLSEEESALREQMQRQLGPGWETSKPGIVALQEFNKRKGELITAANRGELTTSQQLEQSREEANRVNDANAMLRYNAAAIYPYSSGGLLTPLAQAYQLPIDRMARDRALQFQASMAGAQGQGQLVSGLIGAAGTLGGAYLAGPFGAKLGGGLGRAATGYSGFS